MASSIKLRAKAKGDQITVKCLISHPMETGLRKDKKTGKVIPAHFIQEVVIKNGDKTALTALWSGAISKNPYLSCEVAGNKGDKVVVSWVDNQGNRDSSEATAG